MTAPFRIEIPSSRPGVKPYVVERTEDGRIRHDCPAWKFRHTCRHVDRAVALADQPGETFVADACEVLEATARKGVGWWRLLYFARLGDEPCGEALDEILVGLFAGLHQAQERIRFVSEYHDAARARDAEMARRAALPPGERGAELIRMIQAAESEFVE